MPKVESRGTLFHYVRNLEVFSGSEDVGQWWGKNNVDILLGQGFYRDLNFPCPVQILYL